MITENVLIKPVSSEKSRAITNKHVFVVNPKSTKTDIKKAIHEFYGIDTKKITKVNIISLPEKKRFGKKNKQVKKKSAIKKATVTLSPDTKLDYNIFA